LQEKPTKTAADTFLSYQVYRLVQVTKGEIADNDTYQTKIATTLHCFKAFAE
jgi:hypothetical protein